MSIIQDAVAGVQGVVSDVTGIDVVSQDNFGKDMTTKLAACRQRCNALAPTPPSFSPSGGRTR